MSACSAFGCTNRFSKKIPEISFHRFPKDPERRKAWINAVKRKDWLPSNYSVLCSLHFETEQFDRFSLYKIRLRENAVPSIFDAFPSYMKKQKKSRKARKRTIEDCEDPQIEFENTPVSSPGTHSFHSYAKKQKQSRKARKRTIEDCENPQIKLETIPFSSHGKGNGVCSDPSLEQLNSKVEESQKNSRKARKRTIEDCEDPQIKLENIPFSSHDKGNGVCSDPSLEQLNSKVEELQKNSEKVRKRTIEDCEDPQIKLETIPFSSHDKGNGVCSDQSLELLNSKVEELQKKSRKARKRTIEDCEDSQIEFENTPVSSPEKENGVCSDLSLEQIKSKVEELETKQIASRKKIRSLQQTNRRLQKKVYCLTQVLNDLKEKKLVEEDALDILILNSVADCNKEFLQRQVARQRNVHYPKTLSFQ